MSTTSRPKCRSTVIPCRAGERCPEHRGLIKAISDATQDQDLGRFLALKDEEASKEQLKEKQEFLANTKIRKNRKGEIVVTLPSEQRTVKQVELGNETLSFFRTTKGEKLVIPAPHPADAVDKNVRIYPKEQSSVRPDEKRKNSVELFQDGVDLVYDGHVQVEFNHKSSDVVITDIKVDDEYKGHGVEAHVLASVVLASRTDLYDFYGTDKIPYEAYKAKGFEPNPYYWAGKTHPETGVTYPSVEVLESLTDRKKNHDTYRYSGLYGAKYMPEYPYMRLKHGRRFTDYGFTPSKKEFDKERSREIARLEGEREERLNKAKGGWFNKASTTDIS